jgi:nitrogen fixation NifU-like protein
MDEEMSELDDLYQDVLFEHANSKRRRYRMFGNCSCAEAFNPLCGDTVSFFVERDGDTVSKTSYLADGCAISQASASLCADAIEGEKVEVALEKLTAALSFITGSVAEVPAGGGWAALGGVAKFPMRVKCATMAIRAGLACLASPTGSIKELEA